jgi:hypothetical protein
MAQYAVFFFLAAASIAFFSFLIATHWIDVRAAERRTRERFALLKKLADQPSEAAERLLALVREDDEREARREERERAQTRLDEMKGGVILIAVGICLSIFLTSLNANAQAKLWGVGLIPGGIGVVVFAFAYLNQGPRREA